MYNTAARDERGNLTPHNPWHGHPNPDPATDTTFQYHVQRQTVYVPPAKVIDRNAWANIALTLGIVSLVMAMCGPLAIPGAICAVAFGANAKERAKKLNGLGYQNAVAAMVLGIITLVASPLVMIGLYLIPSR